MGQMTVDMDSQASLAGSMRPQTTVYPLQGLGSSDFSVNCAPMASPGDGGVFDYMPSAMAHHRHLRVGSNASSPAGTPTGSMGVSMMGSFGSQQQFDQSPMQQQHSYAAASSYADSRAMYAQSTDGMASRSTGYSPLADAVGGAGSQAFRATDPPPINLPHKRILDEIQGSQRELWRNDSPVSVSAPIFRQSPHGLPLQSQSQPQPHGEGVYSTGYSAAVSVSSTSSSAAFKPSLSPPPLSMPSAYRPQPTSMGPFGGLDQVWTPFM